MYSSRGKPRVFDPKAYWEDRLNANFSLEGVGYRRRGTAFNHWMYESKLRGLRGAIAEMRVDLAGARICEIGCGTGFYFPFWLSHNPSELAGWDITRVSIQRLRDSFPDASLECRNIGEPLDNYDGQTFDLVTALDVLFHVVDSTAFEQALRNLGRITKPGGHVLISDYFWRRGAIDAGRHVRYRSYAKYADGLAQAGVWR